MKRAYLSLITILTLSVGAQVQAWSWNPFAAKEHKKPILSYSEYCGRVLNLDHKDPKNNREARLHYLKAEKTFLDARKEFFGQTDEMKKREAYLDQKIHDISHLIERKGLGLLVGDSKTTVEDTLNKTKDRLDRAYSGAVLRAQALAGTADDTLREARSYLGDACSNAASSMQEQYQHATQQTVNAYNKAHRSCDKFMAGRQPYSPLERLEVIHAAGRNAKMSDLAVKYADDYLNMSANFHAEQVKRQAELNESAALDRYLDKAARFNAEQAKRQAELDKSAALDRYLDKSADYFAQKAEQEAKLDR